MTQPEGQTARDVFPEDDGIPEVSQDDFPTMAGAEDPQFAPLPGERAGASADFGTTAFEQAEGESPGPGAGPRGPASDLRPTRASVRHAWVCRAARCGPGVPGRRRG